MVQGTRELPHNGVLGVERGYRRAHFLKIGLTGLVAVAIGTQAKIASSLMGGTADAASSTYELTMTDAVVEMVNLDPIYHWVYADHNGAHIPGPVLHAVEGDTIELRINNALDEPHAFAIHDTGVTTGPIPPGESRELSFTAPPPGTYIYLDPLNAPVNRLLGLHGILIVLPQSGNTPYASPPPRLQQLFDDLGTTDHFPGEPWNPDRTRIWHVHCVDPRWNAKAEAGVFIDPARLVNDFQPAFFTLNGQSGFFASHDPYTAPVGRIGQPHLIRIANTGMLASSLHIHGNHVYVCAHNGLPLSSVRYIDSWRVGPLERADWVLPFTRPPDIPGPEDRPLREAMREELSYRDELGLSQSPIEYPMHCHMEPSQTARGGNYPGGLVAHWAITGDVDLDFAAVGLGGLPMEPLPAQTVNVGHNHG